MEDIQGDQALIELIHRYEQAYAGRIEILPDGAEVIEPPTQGSLRLWRGALVEFQRPSEERRIGRLRFGLLVDGKPFAVITTERNGRPADYRVAARNIVAMNYDEST